MWGPEKIEEMVKDLLGRSTADQTEVVFLSRAQSLTRFANSMVHQNVSELDAGLRVRVVLGQKIGVASTNNLSSPALDEAVERALAVAKVSPENPDFRSLPEPQPVQSVEAWVPATADHNPEDRAAVVGVICRRARERQLNAAGAFEVNAAELAVGNSLGVFAYHPQTTSQLRAVVMADSGSGYHALTSLDATALDVEEVASVAIDKALRSRDPQPIEPGQYDVVLEEPCVDGMVTFLAYMGLGAQAIREKRSFMVGHFGQRLADPRISLWDDGLDPSGTPLPFDFEGQPKRRVDFFDQGVASAVVYDSLTAALEGVENTGHALPSPNTYGPLPLNLFMAGGDLSREELIGRVDRGLLVTRFHYVNIVHPLKTILTGMTRDGTFLIEKGEVKGPVRNLRFTQSVVEALSRVDGLSRETKLEKGWYGGSRVPALLVRGFTFTSSS